MKSVPRCASDTAPGLASPLPPPTSAAIDVEWCGATNGGVRVSPSAGSTPATERMAASASASSEESSGSSPAIRCASIVLPVPGGPTSSRWCPPAAATSSARRASSWPTTSARSWQRCGRQGGRWARPRQHRRPLEPGQHLSERRRAVHVDPVDERRLGQRVLGHHHAADTRGARREQARQHAAHRPQPPVERQLPHQHGALQRALLDRPGRREHAAGQGEVEPAPGLAQRRRRERQDHPLVRPRAPGVDHRRPHPVARLLQRGVRQADQVHPGQPAPDVGLDLHHVPLDAAQRHRPCPRQPHLERRLVVLQRRGPVRLHEHRDHVEPDPAPAHVVRRQPGLRQPAGSARPCGA